MSKQSATSTSKPTILLTSVTGSVGNEVFNQLYETRKYNIRVVTTGKAFEKEKAKKILESLQNKKDVEVVKLDDINNKDILQKICKNIDFVFLCVPTSYMDTKHHKNSDDEILFRNLIQYGIKSNVTYIKHILYISVMDARHDHPVMMFRNHFYHEQELKQLIKETGGKIHLTIVRAAWFHQNYEKYNLPSIQAQDCIYGCSGNGKICGIDIHDIATSVVKIVENHEQHNGKTYTLATEPAYSHADAARIISKVVNRTIRYVDKTPEEFTTMMEQFGMPKELATDITNLNLYKRDNKVFGAATDVEQLLGRKAISFEKCIQDSAPIFAKVDRAAACMGAGEQGQVQGQGQVKQGQGQEERKEGVNMKQK